MSMRATEPTFDSNDPLAVLLEAVVRSIWLGVRTAVGLVAFAVLNPALVLAVLGVLALDRSTSRPVAIASLAGVVVALVAWRLAQPDGFRRWAYPSLTRAWKGPVYRVWWPHVAARCGLVTHAYAEPGQRREVREKARLRRVSFTPSGAERLLLRLPVGLTPDDVEARTDAIAHAFGARSARLLPARPGRALVELQRRDTLAQIVRPREAGPVDLAAIPIGLAEDGRPWCLRLVGTHLLVAGATGSGKSSVLWSLMHSLSPAIADGSVQIWAVDPKGGMELGPGRSIFAEFESATPEAMCDLLDRVVRLKDERSATLAAHGVRKHTASPASPHILVVIDELATLTAFADRAVIRRMDQALGLLLTQGRAVGITVLAAVQDPGKDVVSWRDLFPTRIAMRLDNPMQVDMVLGDGARDRGARADHISELTSGVAYVRIEGTRDIRRVRAAYLTDADIDALVARIRPPAPVLTVVTDEPEKDAA